MKVFVVTDLHLMGQELSYTKKAVINSEVMLDEMIRTIRLDPEIGLVVLLGDIVHSHTSNKASEILWENKLSKIKRIVNSRHVGMPEIMMKTRDNKHKPLRNRLVSLKGNHDFNGADRWNNGNSYFEGLVNRQIIENPDVLTYEDNGLSYYLQFRNYGEGDKTLDPEYVNYDKVIVFAHDWYHGEDLPLEYVKYWEGSRFSYNLGQAVYGADVFIKGHIHSRFEPLTYKGIQKTQALREGYRSTEVYIPGTNARTPKTESTYRDEGYNLIIDTSNFKVSDQPIILTPAQDYFK